MTNATHSHKRTDTPDTGEIHKLRLVTDNRSCFKSAGFATWIKAKRHLIHIRTRRKSPWTNGVIERFCRSIQYERLYRVDIDNVQDLAHETANYRIVYNTIRPHEAIGMARLGFLETPECGKMRVN
jgi:putative transposase